MSPLPLTEKDSCRNLSFFMSENSWHSYFTLEISVAHTSTRSHLLSKWNLVVYSTFTSTHIWFDIYFTSETPMHEGFEASHLTLWISLSYLSYFPSMGETQMLMTSQIWLKCFRCTKQQYCLCLLWCTGWVRHCTDCWRIASFPSDSLWPYFIHALL